jgi:hypothetical protein
MKWREPPKSGEQRSEIIAARLKSTGIQSSTIPYFYDFTKEYDLFVLNEIENILNLQNGPLRIAEFQRISQKEIDNLDEIYLNLLLEKYNGTRKNRINILNDSRCRSLEKEISSNIEFIKKECSNLEETYRDYTITKNHEISKTAREFRCFFGGKNLKGVSSFDCIFNQIFGQSKIPIENHISFGPYSYAGKQFLNTFRNKIKAIHLSAKGKINQLNHNLLCYISAFEKLPSDLRADYHLDIRLNDNSVRRIDHSVINMIHKRLSELELIRRNKEIVASLKLRINTPHIQFGGHISLYYIRIDYGKRRKPFYKIGITKRSLKERYQGSEFQKISKILFCEKVVNAVEVERLIKNLFEEHTIPLDYFRNAEGKTEFFDVDVLGIDN